MKYKNVERIADIIAMVSFSYVTGMFIEMFISGLTLKQSLISRNASIPLNIITARPFGVYRNWLMRFLNAQKTMQKNLVDFFAFISFQIPIYITVLSCTGATFFQIVKAVSSAIVLFMIMGPLYGMYLDFCRKLCVKVFKPVDTKLYIDETL